MKKTIIIIIGFLLSLNLHAQETAVNSFKDKKGREVLPQVGDISFGINAEPFIGYIGNLFDQTGTNSLDLRLPQNSAIFSFKYVKDPKTFYRAGLRLQHSTLTDKEFIRDFNNPDEQLEDKWSSNSTNIYLSAGIEKRRGKKRFYGFYGAEASISMNFNSGKYEYGNSVEDLTNALVGYTTDFGSNIDYSVPMRLTEYNHGFGLGVGAGLFFGAEYYFLPKISVSGEFNWNISYNMYTEGTEDYEYYNNASDQVETREIRSAGGNRFMFDNSPIGILSINMYF